MSHIGRYLCKIANANKEIAKFALKLLERKGIRQTNTITDAYGTRVAKELAVDVGRGISIEIENGELSFVTDSWGCEREVEDFRKLFEQYYKAAASILAAKHLGYSANMTEDAEGELKIELVSYETN